jgi:hypothetical protein
MLPLSKCIGACVRNWYFVFINNVYDEFITCVILANMYSRVSLYSRSSDKGSMQPSLKISESASSSLIRVVF